MEIRNLLHEDCSVAKLIITTCGVLMFSLLELGSVLFVKLGQLFILVCLISYGNCVTCFIVLMISLSNFVCDI